MGSLGIVDLLIWKQKCQAELKLSQTVGHREKAIKGRLRKISTSRVAPGSTRHARSPRLQTPTNNQSHYSANSSSPTILYHLISSNFPCSYIVLYFPQHLLLNHPDGFTHLHVWSVAKLSNLFSKHCFTTRLMPLTVCCYLSSVNVKWGTLFR